MLNELKFVQGAIAKKDFVPELTHFHIGGGFIQGYNGELGLSCPIAMDLEVTPKAVPFIKAIQTCKDTVQLHMTNNGKLAVKSGEFSAYVECLPNEGYPRVEPEGTYVPLTENIVDVLQTLLPFIAEDASRPWARGILLYQHSAYATNNIILVEHWMPDPFPVAINLPKSAVQEIVRIKEEPIGIQVCERTITFHYEGGKWLRSQAYNLDWPDPTKILRTPEQTEQIPDSLFDQLNDIAPFVGERGCVHFEQGVMRTSLADDDGALIHTAQGCPQMGAYNVKQMSLLRGIAVSADWSLYPAAAPFFGVGLRGVIMGMR